MIIQQPEDLWSSWLYEFGGSELSHLLFKGSQDGSQGYAYFGIKACDSECVEFYNWTPFLMKVENSITMTIL